MSDWDKEDFDNMAQIARDESLYSIQLTFKELWNLLTAVKAILVDPNNIQKPDMVIIYHAIAAQIHETLLEKHPEIRSILLKEGWELKP